MPMGKTIKISNEAYKRLNEVRRAITPLEQGILATFDEAIKHLLDKEEKDPSHVGKGLQKL